MAPTESPASPVLRATRVLEEASALDAVGDVLRTPVAALLERSPRLAALAHGQPIGHALHPLMTDAPIGFWMSASVLDLVGGEQARPAADRLVELGVLAALPTSLTGVADWARSGRRTRRVGSVHAALNSAALALYGGSCLLRRSGRRTAGVATALAAAGLVGASAYLGGHMTSRLGAPPRGLSGPATHRPAADDDEVQLPTGTADTGGEAEAALGHA